MCVWGERERERERERESSEFPNLGFSNTVNAKISWNCNLKQHAYIIIQYISYVYYSLYGNLIIYIFRHSWIISGEEDC